MGCNNARVAMNPGVAHSAFYPNAVSKEFLLNVVRVPEGENVFLETTLIKENTDLARLCNSFDKCRYLTKQCKFSQS